VRNAFVTHDHEDTKVREVVTAVLPPCHYAHTVMELSFEGTWTVWLKVRARARLKGWSYRETISGYDLG